MNEATVHENLLNPLSEQEIKEIQEELSHYDYSEAASIEALKIVQKYRGWVSDESLKAVADILDMSPAQLDGVATFYNLIYRQPVGKYVVRVCNSMCCWMLGYDGLIGHMKKKLNVELGGTTEDGLFTLLPAPCLGDCDNAPVMLVNDDLYQNLTAEKIDQILTEYQ